MANPIKYIWNTWEVHNGQKTFDHAIALKQQISECQREGWEIFSIFYCPSGYYWPDHFMIIGRQEV